MNPATLGAALLRASLDSALWIAALALVTSLVPRIPAGVRCGLWWLASVKALLACLALPVAAVTVPEHVARPVLAPVARVAESARATLPAIALPHAAAPALASPAAGFDPRAALPLALLVVWAAGALLVAARLVRASLGLRARWRAAPPLESPPLRAALTAWLGVARAGSIELRTSPAVPAPLVLGGRRGRILLPESCRADDAAHARMALAHEATHLVRGDLLWAWIPSLAECVFWFHPLLRWSVREYVQAREEACDAQALRWSGAEPEGYGEMLVGFGTDSPRLGHAVSCGSPHVRHLLRRLRMLAPSTRPGRTERVVALAALIVFGATALVPIRLVAARERARSVPVVAVGPGAVAASGTSTVEVASGPVASASGPGVTAHSSSSSSYYSGDVTVIGSGRSSRASRQPFSYGIVQGGRSYFSGSVEDGDWLTVKRLQEHERGKIFWFRIDDRNYVVRDADAIAKVEDVMAPLDELGNRQSKLGDQQSRLGDRQSELGDRQSEIGDRMSDLADRENDLRGRLAEDDLSASERAQIRSQLAEIDDKRQELGRMQGELGRLQGELGAQQGELGRQQGELGRLQGELARKMTRELREMSSRWVDDGRAESVH